MTTSQLILAAIGRVQRHKWLILSCGIVLAILFGLFARSKPPVYTAKATVFPLTNALDNSISSNTLSGILGLGDAPKSFSSDAAINIIELTSSRFVREAVASTRLPQFGNKTITALLVAAVNTHRTLFGRNVMLPRDSTEQAILGGELLQPAIVARMSKNGMLELYFSHADKDLLTPVSNVIIDKVAQFYTDLKIRKARTDYDFTVRKVDSLERIIAGVDRRAIHIQNTTLFAPDRLEYDIPRERVNADKQRFVRQRDISLNNQEEALWRLQKLTPIISILDKPTAPYAVARTSVMMYAVGGFAAGCLLSTIALLFTLLSAYARSEISRSLLAPVPSAS